MPKTEKCPFEFLAGKGCLPLKQNKERNRKMKKTIIALAAVLCVGVSALAEECAAKETPSADVKSACKASESSGLTVRERRDAERCGIPAEQWKAMTKKARKAARQEAKAKALGMTVAEMKAANNRKAAEKAGCDPEKWAKMSVKERIAFRKAKADSAKSK